MNKYVERLYNGIIKENPTLILMLGMCQWIRNGLNNDDCPCRIKFYDFVLTKNNP